MAKLTLHDFKQKNPLIVICGPTASGKTDLSYQFYDYVDSEIISADSRQIYKYMNIGTAKPPVSELNKYKYHLIDFLEPDVNFSAGKFVELSSKIIQEIYSKNKVPLIVGGTGFYISALCEGIMESDESKNTSLFDSIEYSKVKDLSQEELLSSITNIDPKILQKYPDKNPRRLIRALEFYYKTGKKISEAWGEKILKNDFSPIYFGIEHERENLYERINYRCEKMIEMGFVQEVENILNMGFSQNLNSLNTVGYKEMISYVKGKITFENALDEMKKNTRRYAKRQITWFKKNEKIKWVDSDFIVNLKIAKIL